MACAGGVSALRESPCLLFSGQRCICALVARMARMASPRGPTPTFARGSSMARPLPVRSGSAGSGHLEASRSEGCSPPLEQVPVFPGQGWSGRTCAVVCYPSMAAAMLAPCSRPDGRHRDSHGVPRALVAAPSHVDIIATMLACRWRCGQNRRDGRRVTRSRATVVHRRLTCKACICFARMRCCDLVPLAAGESARPMEISSAPTSPRSVGAEGGCCVLAN